VTLSQSISDTSSRRAHWIAAAGWVIIMLAAGAVALPLISPTQGALVIGAMLLIAGLIEASAALFRRQTKKLALIAGVITVIAGLLFSTDQAAKFAPTIIIIAGWLLLRAVTLGIATTLENGSLRLWTGLAAIADLFLAFLLAVGLSASVLVISVFGATEPMIAGFAWILAISFVATGSMLLEVAKCTRREPAQR
jgi:uncharacterized membrane protein HdeD (DUF308 family)